MGTKVYRMASLNHVHNVAPRSSQYYDFGRSLFLPNLTILTAQNKLDGSLSTVRFSADKALVHARVLALHSGDDQDILGTRGVSDSVSVLDPHSLTVAGATGHLTAQLGTGGDICRHLPSRLHSHSEW